MPVHVFLRFLISLSPHARFSVFHVLSPLFLRVFSREQNKAGNVAFVPAGQLPLSTRLVHGTIRLLFLPGVGCSQAIFILCVGIRRDRQADTDLRLVRWLHRDVWSREMLSELCRYLTIDIEQPYMKNNGSKSRSWDDAK